MTKDEIQKQALTALKYVKRGSIGVSVGVGKTLIGLKHMASMYNDSSFFLVVAPKVSIFQSWKDDAVKFNMEYLLSHITFSTYLSLNKQDLDYDAVYLDEAHSILDSHDNWLTCYKNHLIGLTGTPPKYSTSQKGKLFNKHIPIVYKYITDKAVNDKILNDYEILIHKVKLNTKQNIKAGKSPKLFYTSEHANYHYWTNRCNSATSPKEQQIVRIMRMKALMSFKSKEDHAKRLLDSIDDKVILFANTHEQADSFDIESYHSKNINSKYNLEDFKKGTINKLSCVLQLSEGINIPNLKQGIIMDL